MVLNNYRPVPKLSTPFGGYNFTVPLWGKNSHGCHRVSAIKLSAPLQKGST